MTTANREVKAGSRVRDFWPVFRGIVFSADERLNKSEPEIFERQLAASTPPSREQQSQNHHIAQSLVAVRFSAARTPERFW